MEGVWWVTSSKKGGGGYVGVEKVGRSVLKLPKKF